MSQNPGNSGMKELRAARNQSRGLFAAVAIFSVFVNLLMLTGPLFMLQVYDRVLGSQSEETLTALFALVAFLYLTMGFMDYARGRVMGRAGSRFQAIMESRVFSAVLRSDAVSKASRGPSSGLRDLDAVQRLLTSPALLALFDLPWTPLFLGAIFIFHPWLGVLALGGGFILVVITALNQFLTRAPALAANQAAARSDHLSSQIRADAETIQSLGMRGAAFSRWHQARAEALTSGLSTADRSGTFSTMTKTMRLFLQSAMLALGAYLVLQGELTGGAMIAASIMLGRALAPIEQAIGQWDMVQRAVQGWNSLGALLVEMPAEKPLTALPRPKAVLEVRDLIVAPPGEETMTLKGVSFRIEPGQAVGVIGGSGSGKSTLARALTGIWKPVRGTVRLDGATLDQYDPDTLGNLIGYVPQRVSLFDGTVAENIARLSTAPDPTKVVAAAKAAAAHDMILTLPQGYDTPVTAAGGRLSGGQMQRVALARALYGDPVMLVLDEPNSNLDSEGSNALNVAIRQMKEAGRIVLVMAHRPAAIQECDLLMVIHEGTRRAFGPRNEVMREQVKKQTKIAEQPVAAGGSS